AAAALPGADAVLGLVGVVRVRRAVLGAHLLVVAAARVLVAHQERDGRAERQAVVHAREDLDAILLAPLGDDLALAGAAPVELALHVVGRQRDPRRTAVDHHAHARPVRMAESRHAKQVAKGVTHDAPSLAECARFRPRMQDDLPLATDLSFIDQIYETYRRDPAAVDPSWRRLFEYTPTRGSNGAGAAAAPIALEGLVTTQEPAFLAKVWALVNAYRARGHFEAKLDPLGLLQATPHPEIDPKAYGLTDADLDRIVPGGYFNGPDSLTLRELIRRARATYCGTIGVEFMHISSPTRKAWLH